MNQLIAACFAFILMVENTTPTMKNKEPNELPECIVITHCVLRNWEVQDIRESFKKTAKAIANTPRTKIIEQTDSFIHAEAKTKWRRYTDDLLVKALPEKGLIQIRSESRVGIGDNGINKKRVDELAYRLMTNQIKE